MSIFNINIYMSACQYLISVTRNTTTEIFVLQFPYLRNGNDNVVGIKNYENKVPQCLV